MPLIVQPEFHDSDAVRLRLVNRALAVCPRDRTIGHQVIGEERGLQLIQPLVADDGESTKLFNLSPAQKPLRQVPGHFG